RNNSGGAAGIITMATGQDLNASGNGTVNVSWTMWEDSSIPSDEGLDFAFSSDNGSTWSDNMVAFRDDIGSTPVPFSCSVNSTYWTNGFKLRFEMAGMNSETLYVDNVAITPVYSSTDGLDFAVSANGGGTWSNNIEAFRDDVTSSNDDYAYYLPAAYTTDEFKIRFEVAGMDGPGQRVEIDKIQIRVLPPDTEITFEIDGEQVHFDGNGDPHSGSDPLVATRASVMLATPSLGGFSYSCYIDVSKLVKTYPENPGEEYHTGNAEYTVGGVAASTGGYLSHAGWSLIVIYASPSTAGHYLYLRDFFAFNPGSTNLDFDFDGEAGGDITNFVIPEPIRNKSGVIIESLAAKVTCFIGEGDSNYSGDSLEITGQQSGSSLYLSNSASPWNNTWNGASPDMSYPGVDVDTFEVLWEDGILQPGDTSLHLDMDSGTDAWNFIYLIMSVRSETLVSGTTHYAINPG
ncbi:MAG: hypothetical protein MUO19_00505, partial [Dehalococcoidales bacterium]|nr:hypothetical protein [Dehalococcoidales bacterium]